MRWENLAIIQRRGTGKWASATLATRGDLSIGEVSQPGLRDALLDTNPATAFNPFGGTFSRNTNAAINRVYVNLHNTATYEMPLAYATINGDLFNLPAGPVSFAIGGEYYGERWTRNPDSLNTTFQTIGSTDRKARG